MQIGDSNKEDSTPKPEKCKSVNRKDFQAGDVCICVL